MSEKIEQSVRTASICAMRKGLTAYEGEAVYRRYFAKDGKTLDDATYLMDFIGILDLYKAMRCRYLLHEADDFGIENDRG